MPRENKLVQCKYRPIPDTWQLLSLATFTKKYESWNTTSSSARLAIPEVVDRPCWNRVESAYWSGDFQKIFFLFDPSLTSGMSVVLMWGHCLRHRPYIKQHMSAGRVAHRKRLRHRPPHLTATCMRVELMVSQHRRQRANIKKTFFEKLMNIQYLNLPPYPNRWMVWLIQQGLAWRPRSVKSCCQEDWILPNICELTTTRIISPWPHLITTPDVHFTLLSIWDIHPRLLYCWSTIYDTGPTIIQH